MPHSIQNKIASALAPVEAPPELWSRVDAALHHAQRHPMTSRPWPRMVMAAALAALMSGGVIYLRAQQSSYAPSPFSTAAVQLHNYGQPAQTIYSVQRHSWEGQAITIVSTDLPNPNPPAAVKLIHTEEHGDVAVSEWTSRTRRWALVSAKSTHACLVCHRA